ncbi:MAG: ribosome biogenesis GTPase Der [Syntrophorhabdales bacterium]|jgi:GTP-binding protein
MKPIISIVGRPNVGKSTLFNRLIGYRKAITEDVPGVTRDRNYGEFEYGGKSFIVIDTGGFEPEGAEKITSLVKEHIYSAMEESSMIIFLLDAKEGLLPEDGEIAAILRRFNKPVFYVVNKVDSQKREAETADFYRLGVEKLYAVSAAHGLGLGDLLDDMGRMVEPGREEGAAGGIKIAVVGRPNTGKSSIVNRLLGSDRMIVSDIPGTTRDAIDSIIRFGQETFTVIDTAGLRKKSRIFLKVEEHSVMSALRSVERADVVNLVIDGREGVGHQDGAIAHLILSAGKGICIVVNKWDLMDRHIAQDDYRREVRTRLPHADFAPVIFTSALTGENVEDILEIDTAIARQLARRIATPKLNRAFEEFTGRLSPPVVEGKQIKIFYASQLRSAPPTFVLFLNYPDRLPEHYKRFLENSLRQKYGFRGAPIRLFFRKR